MDDLNKEFCVKALLANLKRFIKRKLSKLKGTKTFFDKCFKCVKTDNMAKDCFAKKLHHPFIHHKVQIAVSLNKLPLDTHVKLNQIFRKIGCLSIKRLKLNWLFWK